MKKLLILPLIIIGTLTSVMTYATDDKLTYEDAVESHKSWSKEYYENSVTRTESQSAWDDHEQRVTETGAGGSSNYELEQVWAGSATQVPITWGQGLYSIDINFNCENQMGTLWINIGNKNDGEEIAAIPSRTEYEGNYHVNYTYETGIMETWEERTCGTPKIVTISKFPTPQLDECTPGASTSVQTYCSSGSGRTCETGSNVRTCGSNGGWFPWEVSRLPVCVAINQMCP